VAVDTSEVKRAAGDLWARLRGLPVSEGRREEYFDRLRNRRDEVRAGLPVDRGARRFEASGTPPPTVPLAGDAGPLAQPSAPPRPTPQSAPPPALGAPADPADALERLRRAKKKVWEERKDNES
jgi:hypothetical protein